MKDSKPNCTRNFFKSALLTVILFSIIGGINGCNDGTISEKAAKEAGKQKSCKAVFYPIICLWSAAGDSKHVHFYPG